MRLAIIVPAVLALGVGALAISRFLRGRKEGSYADAEGPLFDEDAEILIIEEDIVPLH